MRNIPKIGIRIERSTQMFKTNENKNSMKMCIRLYCCLAKCTILYSFSVMKPSKWFYQLTNNVFGIVCICYENDRFRGEFQRMIYLNSSISFSCYDYVYGVHIVCSSFSFIHIFDLQQLILNSCSSAEIDVQRRRGKKRNVFMTSCAAKIEMTKLILRMLCLSYEIINSIFIVF